MLNLRNIKSHKHPDDVIFAYVTMHYQFLSFYFLPFYNATLSPQGNTALEIKAFNNQNLLQIYIFFYVRFLVMLVFFFPFCLLQLFRD